MSKAGLTKQPFSYQGDAPPANVTDGFGKA